MLTTAVGSTTLATVSYDVPSQQLWLEFRSRTVYCYFSVPLVVYRDLMAAPSKGAYFNRHIRGCFPYHKEAAASLLPPA
jgi:hypothetical protein